MRELIKKKRIIEKEHEKNQYRESLSSFCVHPP